MVTETFGIVLKALFVSEPWSGLSLGTASAPLVHNGGGCGRQGVGQG